MSLLLIARDLLAAATALVTRYHWQTLTPADLVARVQACYPLPAPFPPEDLDRLCEQAASALLLAACQAVGPPDRGVRCREEAYTDLGLYLNTLACRLALPPGVNASDVVQDSLLIIYQTLPTCREPRAFLAWAATILRRQAARQWRSTPAPARYAAALDTQAALLPDPQPARERHVDPDGDQALLGLLHRCLDTDEERLWALCVMFGLKRRELHLLLDASPAHLDALAQRVRRKLRSSAEFRAFLLPP